jgi:large subunit ribosomal protein L18
MKHQKTLNRQRVSRARRTRAKIFGTAKRPRLTVFRSNRALLAQLIDDEKGVTLAAVSTLAEAKKEPKSSAAERAGELMAKKAASLGIAAAVFDRRAYRYHGRVKAFADGARKGGLQL